MLNNIISKVKQYLLGDKYHKIELHTLPSMNLFYGDDFNIEIRAIEKDIRLEYNSIDFSNPYDISRMLYKIIKYSVKVPDNYTVSDILCCDIMYIFFEIVKLTKNEKLFFKKYNKTNGSFDFIEFNSSNFKYFSIPLDIMELYDSDKKCILIDEYEFRLPRYKFDGILLEYTLDNGFSTLNYIIVTYFSHNISDKIDLNTMLKYNDILFSELSTESVEIIYDIISRLSGISLMIIEKDNIELSIIEAIDIRNILR